MTRTRFGPGGGGPRAREDEVSWRRDDPDSRARERALRQRERHARSIAEIRRLQYLRWIRMEDTATAIQIAEGRKRKPGRQPTSG